MKKYAVNSLKNHLSEMVLIRGNNTQNMGDFVTCNFMPFSVVFQSYKGSGSLAGCY